MEKLIMDSNLSRRLKHEVTQLAPAIFADNMMMLVTDDFEMPWKLTFSTEDCYDEFFFCSGVHILDDVEYIIRPWYDSEEPYPFTWPVNEDTLRRILYFFKTTFHGKSGEDAKKNFLIYCSAMIYVAIDYYNKGVESALTIVFLEVYFLACHILKRMNFKCDLISTLSEFF